MKNKTKLYNILAIFALVIVLCNVHPVSAEVTLWRETIVDRNSSILRLHGYYQFYDDSKDLIGRTRPIPVGIMYSWDNLPYNISNYYPQYPNAVVDWCNLTINHGSYTYNSAGEITNYQNIVYNEQIENRNASYNLTIFQLKHKDNLIIDLDCHYTNPDTVYIDGVTFADFSTWLPAFTCTGCEDTKLEELAKETDYNMQRATKEVDIY